MIRALKDLYWGLLRPLIALVRPALWTLWQYRRTAWFLLRRRGLRALYKFLYTKLVVREAGVGIMDPLWTTFPRLFGMPSFFEIEVTTRCHLKCQICERTYWSKDQEEWNRQITYEQFTRIVDQFPGLKWCSPTGEGTALLHPDFMRMLQYLKDRDVFIEFAESFDLVDEGVARQFIEMGVDKISLSMDAATQETYEAIKIGCNFERTLGNVRRFIALKKEIGSPIPELCFRYIINTLNVHEAPAFVELVRSLGDPRDLGDGSYLEFAGLLYFDETRRLHVPDVPQEIIAEVHRKAEELGVRVTWIHAQDEVAKRPLMRHCAAWTEPYITVTGHVVPCCAILMSNNREYIRSHSLGNILEQPWREIWGSPRYRELRRAVPDMSKPVPLLCVGCRSFNPDGRPAESE